MVVRAQRWEIHNVRGREPIELGHELYSTRLLRSSGWLCGSTTSLDWPLALEAFVNVDDEHQRQDYDELVRLDDVHVHFYDEQLEHLLTRQVRNGTHRDVLDLLLAALRLRAQVSNDRFDSERAKADVRAQTHL